MAGVCQRQLESSRFVNERSIDVQVVDNVVRATRAAAKRNDDSRGSLFRIQLRADPTSVVPSETQSGDYRGSF